MPAAPHFDARSRIFELDSCGGNGKVCLVYKNCTPGALFIYAICFEGYVQFFLYVKLNVAFCIMLVCGFLFFVFLFFLGLVAQQNEIWFLDRSLCWHFLTATFTAYYRLMITHFGLPEWQYSYTPYGPSPQAKVGNDCLIVL